MSEAVTIRTCACCGLVQHVPPVPVNMRAMCGRCQTPFRLRAGRSQSNSRTAAIALAALIIYPFAVSLPMLEIQKLGHRNQSSILDGIVTLLADGQLIVGLIVLLCSVVIPLTKLISLLGLSAGGLGLQSHHQALTYRLIEFTGRWGMLDVLLVAVLVAILKLGNVMNVTPGPAALAFSVCVVLSLIATACFDPHTLWEDDNPPASDASHLRNPQQRWSAH
jgi:paraquat-inducible protein A